MFSTRPVSTIDRAPHPLPETVANSVFGLALGEVRSALGIRASGPPKRPLRRADVQPVEFHVIETEVDLNGSDWEQYVLRYDCSTRYAGFPDRVAARLQAALCEMADNAILHSDTPVAALVGYQVTDGVSQFCVVDVGDREVSLPTRTRFAPKHLLSTKDRRAGREGVASDQLSFLAWSCFKKQRFAAQTADFAKSSCVCEGH